MVAQPELEWCLNCANWVPELHPLTGWCIRCTVESPINSTVGIYIQLERYLDKNADHLEHYMLQGKSIYQAVRLVATEVRPSCLTCGALIKRGPRNSIFCTKNELCRQVRDRYQYLHKRKGLQRGRALALVINEFNLNN